MGYHNRRRRCLKVTEIIYRLVPFPLHRMKTILSSQTVDVPDNGKWGIYCSSLNLSWTHFARMGLCYYAILFKMCVPVCSQQSRWSWMGGQWLSRGPVENSWGSSATSTWSSAFWARNRKRYKVLESLSKIYLHLWVVSYCNGWNRLILQQLRCSVWTDSECWVSSQYFVSLDTLWNWISENLTFGGRF